MERPAHPTEPGHWRAGAQHRIRAAADFCGLRLTGLTLVDRGFENTGLGTVGIRTEAHLSRVRLSERDDVAVVPAYLVGIDRSKVEVVDRHKVSTGRHMCRPAAETAIGYAGHLQRSAWHVQDSVGGFTDAYPTHVRFGISSTY